MAASTERAKGDDPISRQTIEPVAEKRDKEGFEGPWWRYPTLRNALLAGLLAGADAGHMLTDVGRTGHRPLCHVVCRTPSDVPKERWLLLRRDLAFILPRDFIKSRMLYLLMAIGLFLPATLFLW